MLRDAGKNEDALREFEALGDLASNEYERCEFLLQQANCLYRLDRTAEARHRLSEAEKIGTFPSTELMDARLCISEGVRDEAVRKLFRFLQNHVGLRQSSEEGTYVCALEELSRLLIDLGRHAEAVGLLDEALSLSAVEGDQRKRLSFYLGICNMPLRSASSTSPTL